jgi:ABC-type tungstate transport system permease subunit
MKREYWKLKNKTPDITPWRTRFGRGYGTVLRHSEKRKIN